MSQDTTIRRLREELRRKDAEIGRKDARLREYEDMWDPEVLHRGGPPDYMYTQQVLNNILRDDAKLEKLTSCNVERFGDIFGRFARKLEDMDAPPLFAGDSPDPGNRCRLTKRQALLLDLVRKRCGNTQDQLAVIFAIDQSTVCRYIQLADGILEDVLPTAGAVRERVAGSTGKALDSLVPGGKIIVDGTHTPVQRPKDKDRRKEKYSGRKKRFTANTAIITNVNGLVLYAGQPHAGSTHDLTALREDDPDLGGITESMKDKDTPAGRKVTVYADLGYGGIGKTYPGIKLKQPEKRKKGRKLSARQKGRNRRISGVRVRTGHAIGRIKRFEVPSRPYDGTLEGLGREIQVATGLANFHLLWNERKKSLRLGF